MKLLALGLFFGLLISTVASPSKERIAQWRSVSFVVELPAPYGDSRVSITRDGTERYSRIKSITLSLKGKDIVIPTSLYSDLPNPQINTAHVTSEIGGPGGDGVYLNLMFGDKALAGKGEYPLAQIILSDGKVNGRSIRKQTSLTSWSYDDRP